MTENLFHDEVRISQVNEDTAKFWETKYDDLSLALQNTRTELDNKKKKYARLKDLNLCADCRKNKKIDVFLK
jgi:hypothetical protein